MAKLMVRDGRDRRGVAGLKSTNSECKSAEWRPWRARLDIAESVNPRMTCHASGSLIGESGS